MMNLLERFKELPPHYPFMSLLLFCIIRILYCLWSINWMEAPPPYPTSSSHYYILIFLLSYNDFVGSIQRAPPQLPLQVIIMFLYYLNLILTMINKLIEGNPPPTPPTHIIISLLYSYIITFLYWLWLINSKSPQLTPSCHSYFFVILEYYVAYD